MAIITTETAVTVASDAIRKVGRSLKSNARNYANLCVRSVCQEKVE